MAQTLTSRLVMELVDRVTAPASRLTSSLLGINNAMRTVNGGITGQLNAAIERNNAALDNMRGQMFDAVAAGYALAAGLRAPIVAAMELETVMAGIGSKTGMSDAQLAGLSQTLRGLSGETNQYTGELARGVDFLVGMGMASGDAEAAIKSVGIASTATGADVLSMSQAAYAAISGLKVPADQLTGALDIMAAAGKSGGFELRDMAQYFPSVSAAYQAMGQTGTGAVADLSAAFQVLRADSGDASTAATRMQNVLQKMASPSTIKKFEKLGVDLRAELQKAAEQGITPLEAIGDITERALGGDLSRIGEIYEDAEIQAGIRSLIQREEEFLRIREEAMAAQGTIDEDFNRMMGTTAERAKRARIALNNLAESIGSALLPVISNLSDMLTPVLHAFTQFATDHPNIVGALTAITAGFIGLRIAITALTFAGLLGRGGALYALSAGMATVGRAAVYLRNAAAGAIALQTALAGGAVIPLLSKIAIGFGGIVTAISAPIWGTFAAIAAAIAAAGFVVYRYWDRITSVMSGVGQAIGEILAPAIETARPLFEFLAPIGDAIAAGWQRAKDAIAAVGEWLGSFFQRETLTEADKAAAHQAGYDFVMAIWNGMKSVFTGLTSWLGSQIQGLVDMAKTGLRSLDAWTGGGSGAASGFTEDFGVDGERAKGGPISRGKTYLVGEQGPELITASRSGYVQPNHRSFGGGGATVNLGGITVNAAPGQDAMETARQVRREIETMMREAFRGVHADTGMSVY